RTGEGRPVRGGSQKSRPARGERLLADYHVVLLLDGVGRVLMVGTFWPRSVFSHATRVRRGRSQGVAPGVPGCGPRRERAEKSDVVSAVWRDRSCVCSAASPSRLDPAKPCRSGLKRAQSLLAYLACHPGQSHPRDKLATSSRRSSSRSSTSARARRRERTCPS